MTKMKKRIVVLAAIACCASLGAGISTTVSTEAEATPVLWTGFAIDATAVRTEDPVGLRFRTVAERLTPSMKKYNPDAEYYTTLSFTTSAGKSYSKDIPATVWRDAEGWNTVLLDIPESDYATEITAQSFIKLNEKESYKTAPVTVHIAKAASGAIAYGDTSSFLAQYVQGVETLTISRASATIQVGQSVALTATTSPIVCSAAWYSDNESVAVVDEKGTVYGESAGTATITAVINGKTATCNITVNASQDPTAYESRKLTNKELNDIKYGIPTYTSDASFDFYGYSSLTDGNWTEYDAETGTTSTHFSGEDFRNEYRIDEYQDAGMTILMPQSACALTWANGDFATSKLKEVMDKALATGMQKVIVSDYRLYDFIKEGSIIGEGKEFADEAELDSHIRSCMKDYPQHGAFYGVQLPDEPKYTKLPSYGEVYRSIKRCFPHAHIQCNLYPAGYNGVSEGFLPQPSTASVNSFQNKGYGDLAERMAAFDAYLNMFLDETGANEFLYDAYPLTNSGVDDAYIAMMQVAANVAKERGVAFKFVSQTATFYGTSGDVNDRVLSEADLRWLNNMQLGFGVKGMAYFTYFTRNSNQYETFVDNGSFITRNGEKTELYYHMRKIMQENQKFAPVILSFDYQSSAAYSKYSFIKTNLESGALAKVSGVKVSSGTALVSELYDDTTQRYMYMVQNLADPMNGNATQTVKVTFNQAYQYALVYKNGESSVVKLINNTYVVKQNAGEAVYVIPFNAPSNSSIVTDPIEGDSGIWFPGSSNGQSKWDKEIVE